MRWDPYIPVSVRRADVLKEMNKLQKKGKKIQPISINGKKIASSFWGKRWCDYLESFADYDNRLPRGRTYVRNGSVCHLEILPGEVEAIVSGNSLYRVSVKMKTLTMDYWQKIKDHCAGKIGSLLELLQGRLSDHVMELVADHKAGLFPDLDEIEFDCSCPDWAGMCKHVAATMYGIGARLDSRPELLFTLRGVNASDLINTQVSLEAASTESQLDGDGLSELFGIELDSGITFPEAANNKPIKIEANNSVPKSKKAPRLAKAPKKQKSSASSAGEFTGGHIRLIRESIGMSGLEMADLLGLKESALYRLEQTPGVLKLDEHQKEAIKRLFQVLYAETFKSF